MMDGSADGRFGTFGAFRGKANRPTVADVRYVRIRLKNEHLHVQEIEVYDKQDTNLALKKATVTVSSTLFNADPNYVINANVFKIVVYNRTDCCQERLNKATLECLTEKQEKIVSWTCSTDRMQSFLAGHQIKYKLI